MSEGGVVDGAALRALWADAAARVESGIAGLSHEQSLVEPGAGINCINWIAGHIVAGRANCLAMLGVQAPWPMERLRMYLPNSPKLIRNTAVAFEEILPALRENLSALNAAFATAEPDQLSAVVQDGPVGVALARYAQHESFHAGQIEAARRLIGA
ncbi:MAG: DinB family protein [Dehalococcoidia bacterium]|nr:DinB family protein [Dehalococcoidia bacterium]